MKPYLLQKEEIKELGAKIPKWLINTTFIQRAVMRCTAGSGIPALSAALATLPGITCIAVDRHVIPFVAPGAVAKDGQ